MAIRVRHPQRRGAGGSLNPPTKPEIANGVAEHITDRIFLPGDAMRYGNTLLGEGYDDTAAYNNAIKSGHSAHCSVSGTSAIEDTIVMDGDRSLRVPTGTTWQRYGAATSPILQAYGERNLFDGGTLTLRNIATVSDTAILHVGADLYEVNGGPTDKATRHNSFSNFKIVGNQNVGKFAQDGKSGLYIHSLHRHGGNFTRPAYYNNFYNFNVVNCDVGVELSSDANANSFFGFLINQWKKNAIFLNGAYGNTFYGLKMESPLGVGLDYRYAIHLGVHNSGLETDTNPLYGVDGAASNVFHGYAELPGSGDHKVALFDYAIPTTGTVFGRNTLDVTGFLVGGTGRLGHSDPDNISRNELKTHNIYKNRKHDAAYEVWRTVSRPVDDDSGAAYGNDEHRIFSGREAGVSEGVTLPILEIDNIGATAATLQIKLSFAAKATKTSTNHAGEMSWMCGVRGNSAGVADMYKNDQITRPDTSAAKALFSVTAESGSLEDTGKYTLVLATPSLGLSEQFYYTWKVELVHSNLQSINLDWDRDVRYLT